MVIGILIAWFGLGLVCAGLFGILANVRNGQSCADDLKNEQDAAVVEAERWLAERRTA